MRNKTNNGANLGFEDKLWAAADKLRGNMDAAEYKHVVLGRVYEYFLGKFAAAEGKLGGQFYEQMSDGVALDAAIRQNLEALGYGE